jgi:hypothetical protein
MKPALTPTTIILPPDTSKTCQHVKRQRRTTYPTAPAVCGNRAKYWIDGRYCCGRHCGGAK